MTGVQTCALPIFFIVEPADYLSFVYLMNRAYFVITDSGGIQEEAPSIRKPVLVLRNETERLEAVLAGTVKLVGTDRQKILSEALKLVSDQDAYHAMATIANPYGNGNAAIKVVRILSQLNRNWIKYQ